MHLTLEVVILVLLTLEVVILVHLTVEVLILVHLNLEVVMLLHFSVRNCILLHSKYHLSVVSINILLSCLHNPDHEKLTRRHLRPAITEYPPPPNCLWIHNYLCLKFIALPVFVVVQYCVTTLP